MKAIARQVALLVVATALSWWLRGDNMVNVTLRLVDVSSYLIVAGARGLVTQEELGLDLGRHDARATRR